MDNKWKWTQEGQIPDEELEKNPSLHFCLEWDYLVIDNSDPEFECCRCLEKIENE